MKKLKTILPIFIPCASAVVGTAIIVPWVVLSQQKTHMIRNANDRSRHFNLSEHGVECYSFILKDQGVDASRMTCDWKYTSSSHTTITINSIQMSIDENNILTAQITFMNDNSEPKIGDDISFNLHFMYHDQNNNELWTCNFFNNYAYFSA